MARGAFKKATLEDLRLELWLRQRDAGYIRWKTEDGWTIDIRKMSFEHLLNTIKTLEDPARDMNDIIRETMREVKP